MIQNKNPDDAFPWLRKVIHILLYLGPSRTLTLILAPCFIVYGVIIALVGYRSPFIHVLGLPVVCYAALFLVAGVFKFILMLRGKAQVAHTISVGVSTFWFMAIFILAPSVTGSFSAIPWIMIALISLAGSIWPEPRRLTFYRPSVFPDGGNPAMRAIDYVSDSKVRTDTDDTSERETG